MSKGVEKVKADTSKLDETPVRARQIDDLLPGMQQKGASAAASVQQPTQHTVAVDLAMPARNERRLDEQRRQRNAAEANDVHVFGNSTAASILKTRPW